MADVTAAGAGDAFGLAYGIGREVVVQQEGPHLFAGQGLHALLVPAGAKRQDAEHLGLAPREQRAAVGPGQDPHFAGDGPDLVETPSVHTAALRENEATQQAAFEVVQRLNHFLAALGVGLAEGFKERFPHRPRRLLALDLLGGQQGLPQGGGRRGFDLGDQFGVFRLGGIGAFRRAGQFAELDLHVDQRLHGAVAEKNGLKHIGFADDIGAALHHDDPGLRPGHDDVDVAALPVLEGGVDFELPVDPAYPHRGDRPGKRNVGEVNGRRGSDHGEGVRVVFLVHRQHGGDHLSLAAVPLREQRPDGAIDQPRGQSFLFTGPSDLPAEIVARDPPGRVYLLLVLDRQRHKIPGPLLLGGHHGDQDDGVAVLNHGRTGGLFGHLARLDAQGLAADLFLQ